jgi:hypothetical protein
MSWFYRPSIVKSIGELNTLVKEVILAQDFKPEDLIGFDAAKENKRMDEYRVDKTSDTPTPFSFDDSWIKGSVEISLPCDGFECSESAAPKFRVEFYYRKILEVIQAALAEPAAENSTLSHSRPTGSRRLMHLRNGFTQRCILVTHGMPSTRKSGTMLKADQMPTLRHL